MRTLTVAVCAAITATSVSFAVAQAAREAPRAQAAAPASSKQVRKLSRQVNAIGRRLRFVDAATADTQTELLEARRQLGATCRLLKDPGDTRFCPTSAGDPGP